MLELLRAAAAVGQRTESNALPGDILSFTLEYAAPPDLDAERARIAELLEGDGFDLLAYGEDDPNLLILQFQDVPREQSPEFLFAAAQDLNDALGTVSVTPDIDPPYRDVTAYVPGTEGFGNLLWSLCQSSAQESSDSEWARKLIRVPEAEAAHGVSGAGVLVGQPDTGVAQHAELQQGLDTAKGWDFVSDRAGPFDPLDAAMRSPGHGTSTSSCVISRPTGRVTGSARGATLVPVRVVNSVVITSGTAVARGIDHARKKGCRVITMSLGGPFASVAMRRAIARAIAADMIVLAAAGNCVGVVTFPAWDVNMIAVAGVDRHMRKWRGSCSGSTVDISAPGENVYVARRQVVAPGHTPGPAELAEIDGRGQGTSFAVALTAGVAALWIEKFGIAAIRSEAARRGMSVQMFFRHAVRATSQRPAGWDSGRMGAGVVDAKALLDTPLASLPGGAVPTESGNPALAVFDRDFEGTEFATEASYLAFDWTLRQDPVHAAALESPLPPQPSPQFAAEIDKSPPANIPAPAALVAPASPPVPLEDAVKRLAVRGGNTLESAATFDTERALETIRETGTDTILSDIQSRLEKRRAASDKVDSAVQQEALNRMERTLVSLTSDEDDGGVTETERRATLEALVRLTGRPAIRVRGDGSEVRDPLLEDWRSHLIGTRARWQRLCAAVGRIDVRLSDGSWGHAGTGFVMGDGRIMTNRHVIDTFVEGLPAKDGDQRFHRTREASIIFDPEATDETTRFALGPVLTAGKSRIGRFVDLGKLDMAVVEVETSNGHGSVPPQAIDTTLVSMTNPAFTDILLSGYPARPAGTSGPDADSDDFLTFWDRLEELYGDEYGKQYLSPGKVMARPGDVAGDPRGWAFTHDATTMPGNSGSAVISLHDDMGFCGLHFGGATLSQNLAHDIKTVLATGDGVFDTGVLG